MADGKLKMADGKSVKVGTSVELADKGLVGTVAYVGTTLFFSEIIGDGNCFYRAISVYLHGHQGNYREIRTDIIQYMLKRDHEYSRLMFDRSQSQNYEGYLDHHRNDGVWAEHPMIYAAADRYGMDIYVTSDRYSETHYYLATSENPSEDQSKWLHLSHIENNHFNCIGRDGFPNNLPDQNGHDWVDLRMLLSRSPRSDQTFDNALNTLDPSKYVGKGASSADDCEKFKMEDLERELPSNNQDTNKDHVDSFHVMKSEKKKQFLKELRKKDMEKLKVEDPPTDDEDHQLRLQHAEVEEPPKDDEDHQLLPEYADVTELLNESISESCLINTSVVDKTPKQENRPRPVAIVRPMPRRQPSPPAPPEGIIIAHLPPRSPSPLESLSPPPSPFRMSPLEGRLAPPPQGRQVPGRRPAWRPPGAATSTPASRGLPHPRDLGAVARPPPPPQGASAPRRRPVWRPPVAATTTQAGRRRPRHQ